MESRSQQNGLYGVEIKIDCVAGACRRRETVHVECADIPKVLAVLDEHDGDVRIFDRQKRELVFDGRVDELRELLWSTVMGQGESIQESLTYRTSVIF